MVNYTWNYTHGMKKSRDSYELEGRKKLELNLDWLGIGYWDGLLELKSRGQGFWVHAMRVNYFAEVGNGMVCWSIYYLVKTKKYFQKKKNLIYDSVLVLEILKPRPDPYPKIFFLANQTVFFFYHKLDPIAKFRSGLV